MADLDRPTPPTLLADFYKISHRPQYPEGTEKVYATWIPRESRLEGVDRVIVFGFQGFIKNYLIDYFDTNFFSRPLKEVRAEYDRLITNTLGGEPDSKHIAALHKLGYLPLRIRAFKEGSSVAVRTPLLTIENTHPEFFWLTNYLETLFSTECWMPTTTSTIALEYRKVLQKALLTTTGNAEGVGFLGHDFSMRGMASVESASASGAGHLLSFTGTDTIPAISYLERFYGADVEKELVGASIPATEHSVMCAYGAGNELECYRRMLTEVYPTGFVSIVSDTWDLWKVLDHIIPALKDDIMARDGRVVIRPDSGDPVKIVCGDPKRGDDDIHPLAKKGVYEALWDIFGGTINAQGFKVLDPHIGVIYGDAITLNRCRAITSQLVARGFAPTNMVYGIGSFTYQYQTRDTFGFALKSTHVTINGKGRNIYKDPITDTNHMKASLTGRVVVLPDGQVLQGLSEQEQAAHEHHDQLEDVFVDGKLVREQTLADIRERVLGTI